MSRFCSSYSTHQAKQNLSVYLNLSPSQKKPSQAIRVRSKEGKCKKKRKSNPVNNRSRLLKSFNYTNPTEQLQTISYDISSLKLANEILRAKVINENIRGSKEKLNGLTESFVSEERFEDHKELSRRVEDVKRTIEEVEGENYVQESQIADLKEDIMNLIQENKRLKQRIKLKANPSHSLEVLLTKLRR